MCNREKVIKAYEDFVNGYECFCTSDDYEYEMHRAVLSLLKEQEDLGTELTNAVELIHKKNERIEKLLKEQEAIVRCKDCKWKYEDDGRSLCGYHSGWFPAEPNWFCADGVKRE